MNLADNRKTLEFGRSNVAVFVSNLLTAGADDAWGGRGNDVKRARFDGVRSACADMEWL